MVYQNVFMEQVCHQRLMAWLNHTRPKTRGDGSATPCFVLEDDMSQETGDFLRCS